MSRCQEFRAPAHLHSRWDVCAAGIDVGPDQGAPDGMMREVDVGGTPVVLGRVSGAWLAFVGDCTHDACPLAGGVLDGDQGGVHLPRRRLRRPHRRGRLGAAGEPIAVYRLLRSEAGRLLLLSENSPA